MPRNFAVLPIVNETRQIIIDVCLHPILSRYRWYIPKGVYVLYPRPFTIIEEAERKRHPYLARLITKAPDGMYPKHLNGNPLDCRRENLVLVSVKDEAGPQYATSTTLHPPQTKASPSWREPL